MRKESNEIRNGIFFAYVNIIIQIVAYILYTPISLRYLGDSEYGVYSLCMSVMAALGIIEMGLSSAYLKYYIQYQAEIKNNSDKGIEISRLNGSYLIIYSVLALFTLNIGIQIAINPSTYFGDGLTANELVLTENLLIILSINIAFTLIGTLFRTNIQANEKYTFLKGIDTLKAISNPFLGMIVLFFGYKSIAVSIASLVITLSCLVLNVRYCIKNTNFSVSFRGIKLKDIRKYFGFSIFIFIHTLMDQLNWQIDKWILARYATSVAITIYSLGSQINTLFIKVSTAISEMFSSKVHVLVEEKRESELTELFISVGRIQFFCLMLVYTGFIVFGKTFIYYWAGDGYETAYYVGIMLMTPIIVLLSQNLSIEIFRAYELHKVQSIINLMIGIGNFFISIPLCKRYGELGCALGTLLSMGLIYYPFTNYYIRKHTKINLTLFYKNIIPIGLVASVVGVAGFIFYTVKETYSLEIFLISGIIYIGVYVIGMYIFAANEVEKEFIHRRISKMRRRI